MAYKSPFSGMFAAAQDQQDGESSSPTTSSSGGYKSSFSGMFANRRKKDEEEQQAKLEAELFQKQEADAAQQKINDEKSVFQKAGDVAGGVGNFIKDAAVDVKDTAVGAYTGIKDTVEGSVAANANLKDTEKYLKDQKVITDKLYAITGDKSDDATWADPKVKELQRQLNKLALENGSGGYLTEEQKKEANADQGIVAKQDKVKTDRKKEFDEAQAVDGTKVAFQSAETFLNVATLGVGTPLKAGGKAVVKQGGKVVAKQLTKQAFKTALKTGGTEAIEQIIKQGGQAAIKKAAQETLEAGAEVVVKSVGKKIAGEAAKDAAVGAAYGITQTGKNADEDTDINDYLLNMAFGAGIGAAIPVVGAGLKKGFQAGKTAVKGVPGAKVAANAAEDVAGGGAKKVGKTVAETDVNAMMNQAIDEQSTKYGTSTLTRAKNWVGDQVNPYRALAKIDDSYAKATGKQRHLLEAGENLEDLARRSAVSEREASSMFYKELDIPDAAGKTEKRSAADLIQKYKGDSPEGMEFNNYTNAKFDLEFRGKNGGKKRIQTTFDDEQLKGFVENYEARNPDAVKDLALKKKVNDMAVDYMADSGAISKAEGEQIKSAYKNAVPLERIFPDDLARPEVTGKNIGSIAKQTVIQKLEGGSDIPLSNSFDTMLNRVYKAVSQGNRAKLAQKLLERSEMGLVGGSKVITTGANKEARNVLREQAQVLTKGVKHLNTKAKMSSRQIRRLDSELKKLNIEGVQAATSVVRKEAPKMPVKTVTIKTVKPFIRDNAPKTLDDLKQSYNVKASLLKEYGPGAKGIEQMAADIHNGGWDQLIKLNPKMPKATAQSIADQILKKPTIKQGKIVVTEGTTGRMPSQKQMFKQLIEAPPKEVERIKKKIIAREPKLAAKLDEVANIRREMDALKAFKTDIKEVTAEFADDPTTGKQMISGLIDGEPYKMEVPPAIAKAVQGLDNKKVESVLKVFGILKKPFEVTWTGVFNPVFAATSFLVYDTPMSFINSPRGRKVFSAKAVTESFKSLNSNSKFQKALAKEGARPYGGSGASTFLKPDAKAIASQRNLLTKAGFTASNPSVALSKLDVWGGKLANATRTRIARAEYDSLLKIAKREGEDIASESVQKKAMEGAALAYRTIMPDYDTMSHLTRQINSVVPFYAASVAGTRSFGQAIRRSPRETLLKAGTVGLLPTIGVTAYNMASPTGQDFYQDMQDSGKTQILDNNLIVVMPGAHKDDKTGEWSGIVKIPLAPEFRAINQTTWRSVAGLTGGKGPEASHVALSLFDTITGGVRTGENPLMTTYGILAGKDPQTGEQIIKGNMANLPKEEQMYEWTSGAGKFVGGVLGTSPIQGDKILSQFGLVGQTAKNGGKPIEATAENVKSRVSGAYGESASNSFYKTYSPLKAKRDSASREVTLLIKQGKRNEARRKATEFNDTLKGTFSSFQDKYGGSEAIDPGWSELMSGLIIKTSDSGFNARAKQ